MEDGGWVEYQIDKITLAKVCVCVCGGGEGEEGYSKRVLTHTRGKGVGS